MHQFLQLLLNRVLYRGAAFVCLIALAACGSTPYPGSQNTGPVQATPTGSDAQRLLARAQSAPAASAGPLWLAAAEALAAEGNSTEADSVLGRISPATLQASDRFDYGALATELALARFDGPTARALFSTLLPIEPQQDQRYRALATELQSLNIDPAAAASALINTPTPRSAAAREERSNQIWSLISQTDAAGVARQAASTRGVEQGWWQLKQETLAAFTLNDATGRVTRWQTGNALHPASQTPPAALRALQTNRSPFDHIALLLPQSGALAAAGKAVRDGFLAAHLHAGNSERQFTVLDSAAASLPDLLQQAQAAGADLIVGPLDKNRVAALNAQIPAAPLTSNPIDSNPIDSNPIDSNPIDSNPIDSNPIAGKPIAGSGIDSSSVASSSADPRAVLPGLTDPATQRRPALPALLLNYLPADTVARGDVVQFGLAVEDEAAAIARRIQAEGLRRVVVLHNEKDWSVRAKNALLATFDEAANNPARMTTTDVLQEFTAASAVGIGSTPDVKQLTAVVGNTLLVEASQGRHRRLERTLGTDLEFVPRARKDVDAIVAFLDTAEARALRPALRFHFASNVPVYTSSQALRRISRRDLRDLRGFNVSEIPWKLYPSPIKAAVEEAFGVTQGGLVPLYALGVDAYRLADRLNLLLTQPHQRLLGGTGELSIEYGGRVRRDLAWQYVSSAGLTALPMVATEPPE